jgi:hypothetical protein
MYAATVDGHAAPCKTDGGHKAHPGCCSTMGCAFVIVQSGFVISVIEFSTTIQANAVRPLAGGKVSPLFRPPKLSVRA